MKNPCLFVPAAAKDYAGDTDSYLLFLKMTVLRLSLPGIFYSTLEKTEIEHVLEGNNIVTIRPQITDKKMNLVGAIIIQTPLGNIAATINNIIRLVLYSFLFAIIAAVFLSISFTKRVTKPLEDVQSSALKSAEGKFQEVAIPENSSIEIEHLVNTFNYAVSQINETLKQKQQLEKMRKEFVADVSHEFRAPLTSIKGFLEIINDQELTPTELKDCTNIMYKDTEYLEHLLSDLLTLGKLEFKKC